MKNKIRPQDIDYKDEDTIEIEIQEKLTAAEVKRLNKQNAKHWRNGREKHNS